MVASFPAAASAQQPRSSATAWTLRLVGLACLLSSAGCFEKTYADRMAVTAKYYDHLDLLNRNLGGEWSEAGFRLRVPMGFNLVPKPEPPPPDPNNPPAPGTQPEPVEDTRQPGYLGIKLPGLMAAWEKAVPVDEPNGPATRNAYIYLLSNIPLFGLPPEVPGRIDPAKFQEYTVNLLANDLGVQFNGSDWHRENFPNGFNLVQPVTYDSMVLLPERQFEETRMSFKLYITATGEVQTMVLFVYPDTVNGNEKLTERIGLCLETLKMPPNAAAGVGTSPSGANATGAPAF